MNNPNIEEPALPDVFYKKPRAPRPEYVNRVHRVGHPCTLFGWFCRTHWELRRPPNATLMRIFQEGHQWHRRVAAAFAQAGIEYVRQEEPMYWPDLELSGHMDGLILPCAAVSGLAEGESAVCDAKGMSDFAFAKCESLDDLRDSKHWYHRAYVTQPAVYAVHPQVSADWCLIYAVKRSTAETRQIWWRPEDAVMEVIAAKKSCIAINEAIKTDARESDGSLVIPSHLASGGEWCDDCDFQSVCPEHVISSAGIKIVSPEIAELVERRAALKETADEYKRVTDQLKRHFKSAEPGEYVCGDYVAKVSRVDEATIAAKPERVRKAYNKTSYKRIDGGK